MNLVTYVKSRRLGGHVSRMEHNRTPKYLPNNRIITGTKNGKPRKRYFKMYNFTCVKSVCCSDNKLNPEVRLISLVTKSVCYFDDKLNSEVGLNSTRDCPPVTPMIK